MKRALAIEEGAFVGPTSAGQFASLALEARRLFEALAAGYGDDLPLTSLFLEAGEWSGRLAALVDSLNEETRTMAQYRCDADAKARDQAKAVQESRVQAVAAEGSQF